MDWKKLEEEAKVVLSRVASAILAVQANPTVQAIEEKWPAAKHLAADIVGALEYIGPFEIGLDMLVEYGPLFYAFAKAVDLKPADQAFFDELEKNRGSQE